MDIQLSPDTEKRLHGAIQRFVAEGGYWDRGARRGVSRNPAARR